MNGLYITTTELRTKTAELISLLAAGSDVNLIHRSKIVAKIAPQKDDSRVLTNSDIIKIKTLAEKLNLPKLSYEQRQRMYRTHLLKKYGKSLSRH
jgi:antitoxin (DNA-binding transcriptional repressor) of toxin-antitoxin stability system